MQASSLCRKTGLFFISVLKLSQTARDNLRYSYVSNGFPTNQQARYSPLHEQTIINTYMCLKCLVTLIFKIATCYIAAHIYHFYLVLWVFEERHTSRVR